MLVIKPTANILAKQDAGTDVNFDISAVDITASSGLPASGGVEEQGALSSTAAALVTTPASGHFFVVYNLKFTNTGASTRTITVYRPEDGSTVTAATTRDILTLLANETCEWTPAGWVNYDSNGREYSVTIAATQADQETGTSLATFVSPGVQQYHPSACKAWLECGVAADITASYNITSLTDTGTGVVTITIATDFSSANYCIVAQVEATGTTWAVANARETHVRSATLAAGSVALDCIDNTTTTNLVKDPTHWFAVMFGDQ